MENRRNATIPHKEGNSAGRQEYRENFRIQREE
jgi:hypothetical protein